jgi:hypothetical protein
MRRHTLTIAAVVAILMPTLADGQAPLDPECAVNTYTTLHQMRPEIASDVVGDFVLTWHSSQSRDLLARLGVTG